MYKSIHQKNCLSFIYSHIAQVLPASVMNNQTAVSVRSVITDCTYVGFFFAAFMILVPFKIGFVFVRPATIAIVSDSSFI